MLIQRLQLENVKSYHDETIDFREGVHFICGENGAGKTTLVEAIGYALFNVPPTKPLERFLRQGEKRGCVRLWFLADDDREYLSERAFTQRGNVHWRIRDIERDTFLDLHGERDVLDFLRTQALDVGSDLTLPTLFETVIGVPQGLFTAPFLETPARRREVFDRILRVEGYKTAYRRTSSLGSILTERLRGRADTHKRLSQEVEGYDAQVERRNTLATRAEVLETRHQAESARLEAAQRRVTELAEAERATIEAEQEAIRAENRVETATAELQRQEARLAEAEEAFSTCESAREDHEAHIRAEATRQALMERQRKRARLQKAVADLNAQRAALETGIREREATIDQQAKETSDRLREIERIEGALGPQIVEMDRALSDAASARRHWEDVLKRADALDEIRQALDALATQITNTQAAIGRLRGRQEDLRRGLSDVERVTEVAAGREACRADRDALVAEMQRLRAALDQAEKHRRSASGGNCPILGEPCRNVGGDLEGHFIREVERLQTQMRDPAARLDRAEDALRQAEQATVRLQELGRVRDQIDTLDEQVQERVEELRAARDRLRWYVWEERIAALAEDLRAASVSPIEAGERDRERRQLVERLRNASQVPLEDLDVAARLMREASDAARDVRKGWSDLFDGRRRDAEAAQGEAQTSVAVSREELKRLQTERGTLERRNETLARSRDTLVEEREALARVNADIRERTEAIDAFGDLDAELDAVSAQVVRTQGAHERYVANEKLAGTRDAAANARDAARDALDAATRSAAEAKARLVALREAFDPAALAAARREESEIAASLARTEEQIISTGNELAEATRRIAEMEDKQREIAALEQEIARMERAHELAQFVRTRVLNRAAERLSDAYRHHVSEHATVLYRRLSREMVQLAWKPDYEIVIRDVADGLGRERVFGQLSGGEQMTAALAVRLALLRLLSGLRLAIFDEPTTNLDAERRQRLAEALPELRDTCRQLIIISHDDTFDSVVDDVIRLDKTTEHGSRRLYP